MTTGEAPAEGVRYGLIGFGRIGRRIATRLRGRSDAPRLSALLVRPAQQEEAEALFGADIVHCDPEAFIAARPGLVAECASAAALREFGTRILGSGADLMPLSLAALADRSFEAELIAAARRGPGRLEIPAGAMGSIDFLAAAREDELKSVTFRAIYPAQRWRGSAAEGMFDVAGAASAQCFLTSSVREAVALFPRHINVAVGVALAGLGLDDTRCELWADPALTQATFEIEADAGPGPVALTVRGRDAALFADPVDYTTFSLMRLIARRTARIML